VSPSQVDVKALQAELLEHGVYLRQAESLQGASAKP
jgi:hypothetical protein